MPPRKLAVARLVSIVGVLALLLFAFPLVASGADRLVIMEEFTATW